MLSVGRSSGIRQGFHKREKSRKREGRTGPGIVPETIRRGGGGESSTVSNEGKGATFRPSLGGVRERKRTCGRTFFVPLRLFPERREPGWSPTCAAAGQIWKKDLAALP